MKKVSSIITIFVIVIIASLIVWKVGTPNLISKNKENTTEKVSKKVEKESKKTKKKKEISKAKSSTTETSSSVESEPSSESSSESTSSASSYQSNVRFPELQAYAGKTYYAVGIVRSILKCFQLLLPLLLILKQLLLVGDKKK